MTLQNLGYITGGGDCLTVGSTAYKADARGIIAIPVELIPTAVTHGFTVVSNPDLKVEEPAAAQRDPSLIYLV